jgi:tetratricopeptide (TPR) repeat protein
MGDLASAYRLVMQALFYNQHLDRRMAIVSTFMTNTLLDLLERASSKWIDLDGDEEADPGSASPQVWVARLFVRLGENREGRSLLLQALQKEPGDNAARQLLQKLDEDEERNRDQGRRWSFWKLYVLQPFNRHRFFMACAYLPQAWRWPAPFGQIGEMCLDHALKLSPASADAHLLKGWYAYHQDRVADALARVHQAIELDTTYAKSWLALGFFQIKAGSSQSAIDALRKTLELYPGCPDRVAIKDLMTQLYLGMHANNERSTPQGAT